jgi:hypothetical protein
MKPKARRSSAEGIMGLLCEPGMVWGLSGSGWKIGRVGGGERCLRGLGGFGGMGRWGRWWPGG